jgi:hypothetical protein
MIRLRSILAAVFGVLALTANIHADMMSPSSLHARYGQSPRACVTTDQQCTNLYSPFGCPSITEMDLPPVKSLPAPNGDLEQARQMQPVQILSDGQTSFSLCLYALLGLGLCKSAPFVKKLSFGIIPQWYHDGGPSQIGHSHAVGPNCLCSATVCFIQPDCTAENHAPQYHFATVVFLWWKSQFTPNVLASRGPPLCCC